jgi:hypothetical protein
MKWQAARLPLFAFFANKQPGMKRTIYTLLLSLFAFQSSISQNIVDLETFEKAMKPGAILTYDITMGDKRYQLIATIKKLGDEIVFDWATTNPIDKKGMVTMNTNAVAKADALSYDF